MNNKITLAVAVLAAALIVPGARADRVWLSDGSVVQGSLERHARGKLTLNTAFAGTLSIDTASVVGLQTDDPLVIQLASGDRLTGRLLYTPERGQQRIVSAVVGTVTLRDTRITAAWPPSETGPAVAATEREYEQRIERLRAEHRGEVEQIERRHQGTVAALEERTTTVEEAWSGNIAFGLGGAEGNTERFRLRGRGEADYDAGPDRIALYAEGTLEKEDGDTTVEEVIAGASLEHDLTDWWFTYGAVDFESDEFENLSLRGEGTAGFGYFVVRRPPQLTYKLLAGLGYRHESFDDGGNAEQIIYSAGWDLDYRHDGWMDLGHRLRWFPSVTEPSSDYRLVSRLQSEFPISNERQWRLRVHLRNDYDSQPSPGVDHLDTVYGVDVVYDWK